MKDNESKKISLDEKFCGVVALAVIAAVAVLFTVCHLLSYDADIGYFRFSALSVATVAVGCLLPVAGAILAFLYRGDVKTVCTQPDVKISERLADLILFAGMLYLAFVSLYDFVLLDPSVKGKNAFKLIACLLTFGGGSVYFLGGIVRPQSGFYAGMGYLTVASLAAQVVIHYFDWNVPMNSAQKEISCFALIAVMLYLLAEIAMRLGIGKIRPWLFTVTFGAGAAFSASLPRLVLYCAGKLPDRYAYFNFDVVMLFFGVYLTVRLVNFSFGRKKEETV